MYRIGIDIGGTKINAGLFEASSGKCVAEKKFYVSDMEGVSPCAYIKDTVKELCESAGADYGDIASCGVGIPGTVSSDGKKILKVPNIGILSEDIAGELEAQLGIPVGLVQDSRGAAWGEYLFGGGRGCDTVVCITLGTGIGTGIVMGGRIYNGALGCAGELGHLPVVRRGRQCGCGKRGCMEKYCAGGGLDITAREILGDGKTSQDLFDEAEAGNASAKKAIDDAVQMLGAGLVSIVNLMSPDCILFSGGLSEQEELYLNPLMEYIGAHCYMADKLPVIKKAELGADSPLYGAAFAPVFQRKKPQLSASIMCADILNMNKALKEIEDAGIQYLHCDIMDNHFVPNLMMPMEFLNKLRPASNLPFDFHIMAENPETVIEKLDIRQNDIVSIHYESTYHLHKVISLVKEKGALASVALNPSTSVSVLEEILPMLDMVLIMSVNPGFAGQKIIPESFDKIRKLRTILAHTGLEHVIIQVDGNCSFENVPKMYEAGADMFVVGTSSVFKKDMSIREGTDKLMSLLK